MKRLKYGALLVCGILFLTAGFSDTNEIGTPNAATFRTTGTLLVQLVSSTDAAGNAISTWTKITRFRFVAGGDGVGGTVTLALHLKRGWATFTLDDNAEWSDEIPFKEIHSIHVAPAGSHPDSVAVITAGGVQCQLILEGEGG